VTHTSMQKLQNRRVRDFGWEMSSRGRFATPADSPLHDGAPYRGLHVRGWGLGFVHRSRTTFCRAVPTQPFRSAAFSIAVPHRGGEGELLGQELHEGEDAVEHALHQARQHVATVAARALHARPQELHHREHLRVIPTHRCIRLVHNTSMHQARAQHIDAPGSCTTHRCTRLVHNTSMHQARAQHIDAPGSWTPHRP
jgi:hypothetical protein